MLFKVPFDTIIIVAMPSITYCIGNFLAILVVNVLGSDYHFLSEPNLTLSYAPHNFYYTSHEFLMMEIILKNISPSVTAVHLQYKYPHMELKVNIEKPNENEVKFMILKHLVSEYTSVNLELHSQSKICGTANIAEGRDGTTLIPLYGKESKVFNYQYNKVYHKAIYCVAPNPCRIIVDLRNQCQEQTLADVSCNIEKSQYICTINKQQNTMTFYQTYGDGSNIGSALKMEMSEWTTTKLIINLELFDNNTLVKIGTTRNEIILDKELSFTADDINSEDYGSMTIRYSESTDVEYRCQEPKEYRTKYKVHVVGLINTTDNKITTHNTTLIQRKFKMADNGTILCCLCYVFATSYNMYGKKVSIITRNVKNKTLLFYEAQESISNNFTESKEQTKAALADWLIYLVPTFLGISVLMLALYIIIKQKHCCTNSQPVEETVELDNCATQNQVLYANLDLVRDGHQPESQREESHYANIIGSLHPLR